MKQDKEMQARKFLDTLFSLAKEDKKEKKELTFEERVKEIKIKCENNLKKK